MNISTDPCTSGWSHITCNSQGYVTRIDFSGSSLKSLDLSIFEYLGNTTGAMTQLTDLNLAACGLTGLFKIEFY